MLNTRVYIANHKEKREVKYIFKIELLQKISKFPSFKPMQLSLQLFVVVETFNSF